MSAQESRILFEALDRIGYRLQFTPALVKQRTGRPPVAEIR